MTGRSLWDVREEDFPRQGTPTEKLKFLLQYAVLAPSTRNTQPWKFAVTDSEIILYPDESRWQRVADIGQRELYLSLGCALENLLIAAEHFGYTPRVEYTPTDRVWAAPAAMVRLDRSADPEPAPSDRLFPEITKRHTEHELYEPYALPTEGLHALSACAVGRDVFVQMVADPYLKSRVEALSSQAHAAEFANPSFRRELGKTVHEDVFGASWLLAALGQIASGYPDGASLPPEKDRSAGAAAVPMIGLLSSSDDSHESQIKTGQVLERLWLTATHYGIQLHPISQITQVQQTREELARLLLPPHLFPQIPFRLGYSRGDRRHTPRRPLEDVLLPATE